jgi:hypothetical protein
MKKNIIYLSILLSLLFFSCEKTPEIKEKTSTLINVFSTPIQEPIKEIEPIILYSGKYEFKIIPKAKYSISAEVVSASTYQNDWNSKVAPVDLALVWGTLANPDLIDMIEFSQKNRWYFYRFPSNFPKTKNFIVEHSANTHMIPSNENLRLALKTIKKYDFIKAKGYLVRVEAVIDGKSYWWNSSLSRKDSGNNSCELFYITNLQINKNIY